MPIPADFDYKSEDEFNQRFVIPLLHKLGFAVVANYHGASEFGKDLVFAEIDRLGHIRFHAVQTKYVPSISLNAIEELILDCKQSFNNTFTHPQTGSHERISTFYAVNGGSVSDQATQHFFNSLTPAYGGNVRLLSGKDLLVLDRWASPIRATDIQTKLAGMILEVRFNNRQLAILSETYAKQVSNNTKMMAPTSTKVDAIARFLAEPPVVEPQLIKLLETYWCVMAGIDDLCTFYRQRLGKVRPNQNEELHNYETVRKQAVKLGEKIEAVAAETLRMLQEQMPM